MFFDLDFDFDVLVLLFELCDFLCSSVFVVVNLSFLLSEFGFETGDVV